LNGKWYEVIVDKQSWGGEAKNAMCIESTFASASGAGAGENQKGQGS